MAPEVTPSYWAALHMKFLSRAEYCIFVCHGRKLKVPGKGN